MIDIFFNLQGRTLDYLGGLTLTVVWVWWGPHSNCSANLDFGGRGQEAARKIYILYHTLLGAGAGAGAGDLDMLVEVNEKKNWHKIYPQKYR